VSGVQQLREYIYHLPPTKSFTHIAIDLNLLGKACHRCATTGWSREDKMKKLGLPAPLRTCELKSRSAEFDVTSRTR